MIIGNGQAGLNPKGGVDVNIQSQTAGLFQYFLQQELKTDILLTSSVAVDDEVINVSSGHGFTGISVTPGELITIFENERFEQQLVKSVSGDQITLSYPNAVPFSTNAVVVRGNNLLNKDGSTTPIDYRFELRNFTIPIDISFIVITMTHVSVGNDGLFGGIAELTDGFWFRKENSINFNLNNYKNNQDFKNVGASVDYAPKGPGASESTTIILELEKTIFGNVIRIEPLLNDVFRGQNRDNLTGLNSMIISLIGSYTEGE